MKPNKGAIVTITEAMTSQLLRRCHPNHLARDLAKEIARVQGVAAEVARLDRQRREYEAGYRNALSDFDRLLAEVRRTCPHPATTHYADPCGRDSYDSCDVCGGTVPPNPEAR